MRRVVSDLVTLAGRRPGKNASSLRNRGTQRRQNSTTKATERAGPNPAKESTASESIGNTVPSTAPQSTIPPLTGSAASSAGAATSPLPIARSRSAWDIIKSGPVGRFGRWYIQAQEKRPYVTQLSSSFIIYLAGDLSAQLLFPSEAKPKESVGEKASQQAVATDGTEGARETTATVAYDPLRTMRHLTVGLISSIPAYKWFMFLHHNFNYASKFLSIATKVAVQQAVFTPVFNTYFFSMQSLLAGATLEETFERLKKALPSSIKNSVKLWPAITAFSFMYVPPHFRAVFGGSIAVGWQTYLSWLNQKAAREVAASEAAAAAAAIELQSSETQQIAEDSRVSQAA